MRVNSKSQFRGYGICASCSRSTFMQKADGGTEGYCSLWHPPIQLRVPIEACTGYNERGLMDLYDMKKIAIIIEINPKGEIGFLRPGHADYKKIMEQIVEPDED